MTMEQVVTQRQQELLTLWAQVTAESGLVEAVRAINHLATAQVRKDTASLINAKAFGRPKEFSGKEDFQQCDQGVWDDVGEISQGAVDLEFLPTVLNGARGVQNLEFVLRQMHTALLAFTSREANDIRTRWRHGKDCRNDMIRR